MNVLYFGKIVDEELHSQDELLRKNPYRTAQYSFEKAFCDEMCKKTNMKINSIYQMENFPKERLFFYRKKKQFQNTEIKYISYINLPFIKEISYFLSTCRKIFCWKFKDFKNKQKCIYINTHYPPVSLAIVLMGKLLRIKKVITFTDLSLFTYSEERIKKMPIYKKIIIKPYILLVNKLQKSYDMYILFAEPMKEIVNTKNKPYIVIEGIYNSDKINLTERQKCHAIAHAGTLNKEVGIKKILDVFEKIEDDNLELWLIGKGDMDEEIIQRAKKDTRIKHLGFMKKEEVFEYLKQAELLINLRNPDDEYTKYSFPSKTFEYMASGTPFLTTKLKGIPNEYASYLYMPTTYSTEDLKVFVENTLKNKIDLMQTGKKAQRFVLEEKNKEKQVEKISNFIENNIHTDKIKGVR